MAYIKPEIVQEAKRIDLLTYLQTADPNQLVHLSGGTYCTKEHDSLKISNGKWNWFSHGFGGTTAVDYLIKVQGLPFQEAVECVLRKVAGRTMEPTPPPKQVKRELELPEANTDSSAVFRYLTGRGIDRDILRQCMAEGHIYESKKYHNAVFLGFDETGQPRYAALRGTYGDFKGEAPGSDKHYSFLLADSDSAQSVHLFECAIDALSYATLLKMTGRDWKQAPLLSLAGVYTNKQDMKLPMALGTFLEHHREVKTILLHLDNDEVGRSAAAGLQALLSGKYQVLDLPAPDGKDVNEYLVKRNPLSKSKTVPSRDRSEGR